VAAPERLVATEWFDGWFDGESLVTMELADTRGRTLNTITARDPSTEVRDAVLASPMKSGIEQGYARLDRVLAAKA
jgi:uncharacterized protein YndB with AHSA1/START domain